MAREPRLFYYLGIVYLKNDHTDKAFKQYKALRKIDIEKARKLFSLIGKKKEY